MTKTKYKQIMNEAVTHYGAVTLRTADLKIFFAKKGASYVPQNLLAHVRSDHGTTNLALWSKPAPVGDMRIKTSVTLTKEMLEAIDKINTNRSEFLERAAKDYIAKIAKARRRSKV